MALEFEWDRAKAADNLAKHGVSFEEGSTVFDDPLAHIVDDPRHSRAEQRYAMVGLSHRRHLIVVMFTERETRIRIISARRSTPSERRDYEETQ